MPNPDRTPEQIDFLLQATFTAQAAPLIDEGMYPHEAFAVMSGPSYVPGDFEAGVAEKMARLRGAMNAYKAAETQQSMGLHVPDTLEGM